mgnify:FL=1
MINMNLKNLRNHHGYTQEDIAEHLQVSRQAVAKWEKGESMPDIENCMALAKLYNVTLDNLVNFEDAGTGLNVPPKGKHFFGAVTVGERGQIVIPKKARDVFHIKPGHTVIVVGDDERGLAVVPESYMNVFFNLPKLPLDD